MKIDRIASVIEAVYYNGRIKADNPLDLNDFIELARMAHAQIMRILLREQRAYGDYLAYYSQHIDRREYTLSNKDAKGRYVITINDDSDILKLPKGMGVWGVSPVGEAECQCSDFVRVNAGGEWLLCGPEFEGMPFYVLLSNRIEIHNAPDCLKKIEVTGIHSDEDLDIPSDVAFDIVNAVLGTSLKLKGYPVDKTDNQNPNVEQLARLTQSQP